MVGDLLVGLKLDQLVEAWDYVSELFNFVDQGKGILVPDST